MLKREDFCPVWQKGAKEGKTALEIARELGLEGEDEKVSQMVSHRAALYRRQLRDMAEQDIVEQELDEEAAEKLRAEVLEIMPTLTARHREAGTDLRDYLRGLVEKADAPQ
jgi:hypothetical protein